MGRHPKIIVLILSYNGKNLLFDSITSYLSNDYPNFEVVVIDNGSVDGTKEYVNFNWPDIYVLRTEKNLGYSGGFNFGLDYAFTKQNADYVLITNNDVKVDGKVIFELVKTAESDSSIGFVSGKVYYFDNPTILQTVGKNEDDIKWNGSHIGGGVKDIGQFNQIEERVFLDDIFILVSKEVYTKVGAYDTEFFLQCEEWDWQARAKQNGFKLFYTPFAKIWHKESMTIGKWSPTKAYYDARNPGIVIMKYKDQKYINRYFWNHTYQYILKNFFKNLLKGNLKISTAILSGYLSMIVWGLKNKKLRAY